MPVKLCRAQLLKWLFPKLSQIVIKNADAKAPPLKSQWIWNMIGNLYFYQIPQEISIMEQVWETLLQGNLKVLRPTGGGLVPEVVQPWARESSLPKA